MNALSELTKYMVRTQRSVDVCSNNIANMNSCGFKRQLDIQRDRVDATYVDSSPGALSETTNQQDLALRGQAYFTVRNGSNVFYTRDGHFKLNEKNQLVTERGDYVLGKKGIITVNSREMTVDNNGNVFDGGTKVDSLLLAEPQADSRMVNVGNGMINFRAKPATGSNLVQSGALEESNVNSLNEMVRMIELIKNFDMGQRFVKMQDTLMGKISTEVGKSTN
ncbi:MAG: flagellar hook basal-body protein [Firmicutes bacterium]|nr:flagellar hook basal-body protein [Bacillota bacterium]